jgi:hypothetical protein
VLADLQSLAALAQLHSSSAGSPASSASAVAGAASSVPSAFALAPAPLLHSWSLRAGVLRDAVQPLQMQAELLGGLQDDMQSLLAQAGAYLQRHQQSQTRPQLTSNEHPQQQQPPPAAAAEAHVAADDAEEATPAEEEEAEINLM